VAAIGLTLSLPPVRAAAREFLDYFRIQRFVAVPVDTERIERLQRGGIDLRSLVEGQIEVLEPAEEPEAVDDVPLASVLAGVDVRQPSVLPRNATFAGVEVIRPGGFRVRLDTAKIRALAEAFGIDGTRVRDSWEGATMEVHAPPAVALRYERGESEFVLVQSRGPEVELPEDVELAELGALGLQMAGMSAEEARLFAARVDWRSTLLVPIPSEGGSFREVEIQGRKGILVSGRARPEPGQEGTPRRTRWTSVLLWADDDRVYALAGPGHGIELLEMAGSIDQG
jgi:hypothetical protein